MDFILSLVTLTAIALVIGAFFLWRRQGVTKQVGLMILLAVVMIANVLIWSLPPPAAVGDGAEQANASGE